MSWYCLSCQSCHGNWMPQSKCCKVINLTLRTALRKNFATISPVKWFMSFVKTLSLRFVGIRKVGREYFYRLEVFCVLFLHLQCIRPQLGLTRNHHLSVCFGRESFAHCGENSAQHLHKACLKSCFGFVLRSLIPGCLISAGTLLCFFLFFVFCFTFLN